MAGNGTVEDRVADNGAMSDIAPDNSGADDSAAGVGSAGDSEAVDSATNIVGDFMGDECMLTGETTVFQVTARRVQSQRGKKTVWWPTAWNVTTYRFQGYFAVPVRT